MLRTSQYQNAHDPFEGIETLPQQGVNLAHPRFNQNAHDPFEGIETTIDDN